MQVPQLQLHTTSSSVCQQRTTHAARAKTVVGIMTVWFITAVTSTISGELTTLVRLVVTCSLLCQQQHSVSQNNARNEYEQIHDKELNVS